jgi:outer membrane lipoprotein carrier protein
MRKLIKHIIFCSVLFLSGVMIAAQSAAPGHADPKSDSKSGAKTVSDIADGVDRYYNSLQSLKADFSESYRGAGLQRSESGTLWLKQPGRMRWEYRTPAEKLFISDGKTAWFYVPGEQRASKSPVKKLDDLRSPLRYLLGKTKLQKEFDALSLAPDAHPITAGDVILRGVPKGMNDRVQQVMLEINVNNQIDRIVIEEVDGAITEFRFSNMEQNLPIAEQRFHFAAPPGVEVVDVAELAPQ